MSLLNEERNFFDSFASTFHFQKFEKWLKSRKEDPLWNKIIKHLSKLENKKVLDLGCGLGFDSIILASRGAYVTGIDISFESVKNARLFAQKIGFERRCEFFVMNATELNFPDKEFDYVFGRAILHHVDLSKCLKESFRVSKKSCIFIEPLSKNPIVNINRKMIDKYDRTPHEHPYSLNDLLKKTKAIFPRITHEEHYLLVPSAYIFQKIFKNETLFKKASQVLDKIDKIMCKGLPILREYCWISIIIAEK